MRDRESDLHAFYTETKSNCIETSPTSECLIIKTKSFFFQSKLIKHFTPTFLSRQKAIKRAIKKLLQTKAIKSSRRKQLKRAISVKQAYSSVINSRTPNIEVK